MKKLIAALLLLASPTAAFAGQQIKVTDIAGYPNLPTNITGSAGSTATLATPRTFSYTGDATGGPTSFDGSANVSTPLTLAGVGTAGTYGDSTHVPVFTTDAKGRVTGVTATAIAFPSLTGYAQLGVAQTWTATQSFAAISSSGITGPLTGNVTGNVSGSSGSTTGNALTATTLQTARTIDVLTGDVTSPGASFSGSAGTTSAATLAAAQPGTHTWAALNQFGSSATSNAQFSTIGALTIRRDAATATNIFGQQNYGITAVGMGFVNNYTMGTGGVAGPIAYQEAILATDTWATTANQSSRVLYHVVKAGVDQIDMALDGTGIVAPLNLAVTGASTFNGGFTVPTGQVGIFPGSAGAAPGATIAGAAGTNRILGFQTVAANRWLIFASSAAESGSNAGSDMFIRSYADDGTTSLFQTSITRATGGWAFPTTASFGGAVTLTGGVAGNVAATGQLSGTSFNIGSNTATGTVANFNAAAGAARQFQVQTAGSFRWIWGVNTTAESGGNAGSDYFMSRYSDAGAGIDSPFNISRATGLITMPDGVNIGGTTTTGTTNTGQITSAVVGGADQFSITGDGAVSINLNRYQANANPAAMTFNKSRGTAASPSPVINGDLIGQYTYSGRGTTAFQLAGVLGVSIVEPTPSDTAMGSQMFFETTPLGTVAPAIALILNQDGSAAFTALVKGLTLGTTVNTIGTDAAATYTMTVLNGGTQWLNVPITANRTVTLPAVVNGTQYRFVRTAASTGAFTWSIGAVKALSAGQWVDIQGIAGVWVETAFGSL